MASRNFLDGLCNATDSQRAEKLGSDDLIDKLYYPLGFIYLSSIISSFVQIYGGSFLRQWKKVQDFKCMMWCAPQLLYLRSQVADTGLYR